ncbi:MAG: biotin-dependent carboxyltransferase family protein, partial [Bacteroidota bacterium]
TRSGARCYLCVHGGILCPLILGSASTHLLTGIGGLHGRPLKKGDRLEIKALPQAHALQQKQASPSVVTMLNEQRPLRVTIGPQAAYFSQEAQTLLFSSAFSVSEESNRMGLRLTGPALQRTMRTEMLTEGVSLGAIQVPQDGWPIILFVEHQTTGGYPKIANVVSADFHRVGQLRPRDEVRFELVTFERAAALYREQEELIGPHSLTPV